MVVLGVTSFAPPLRFLLERSVCHSKGLLRAGFTGKRKRLLVNEPFYKKSYKCANSYTELRLLSVRNGFSDVQVIVFLATRSVKSSTAREEDRGSGL